MESLKQDIHYTLRLWSRNKAFYGFIVLTLACCLGANTLVFSILESVVLRPLPYEQSDRMISISNVFLALGIEEDKEGINSIPDYFERREHTEVFDKLAMYFERSSNFGNDDYASEMSSMLVTANFFDLFSAKLHRGMGRFFNEEENVEGNHRVVILSYDAWRNAMGADPDAVGKTIMLDGNSYEVVGVMDQDFSYLDKDIDIWRPFPVSEQDKSEMTRSLNFVSIVGTLAPGVSIEQAQQLLDTLNKNLEQRNPIMAGFMKNNGFKTRVCYLKEKLIQRIRPLLLMLQTGVGFVLLIGCVNIANLLLIQSGQRAREMAVRMAIGGSRRRLFQMLFVENLMLTLLGSCIGFLLGALSLQCLDASLLSDIPRANQLGIHWGTISLGVGFALLWALLFALLATSSINARKLTRWMAADSRTGSTTKRGSRFRSVLVSTQFALIVVLLSSAALLGWSFNKAQQVDPGFEYEHLMTARFQLPQKAFNSDEAARSFLDQTRVKIEALPGVDTVACTSYLPLLGPFNQTVVGIENYWPAEAESSPTAHKGFVSDDYFQALGIPLLDGKTFSNENTMDTQQVAIIDRRFAERYWPDTSPIGHRIGNFGKWQTIVGVVENVRVSDLLQDNSVGMIYFPVSQHSMTNKALTLLVKSEKTISRLPETLGNIFKEQGGHIPLYDIQSMEERVDASLLNRKVSFVLMAVFAAAAIVLSAIGIYGLLRQAVEQRRREFGILMAMGAQPAQIRRIIYRFATTVIVSGLLLGTAGAFMSGQTIRSQLYQVQEQDPMVYLLVIVMVGFLGFFTASIPALTAGRIEPQLALRNE